MPSGPDFIGIGAQKAGTTWLHANLAAQRRFWMPPHKELHFFDRVCPNEELLGVETRGVPGVLARYRPVLRSPSLEVVRWIRRYYHDPPSTRWYRGLFPPSLARGRIAGEITPAYSTLDARGVAFARRVLPSGCRVFLIVRNPIERAWSALKMLHRWRDRRPDAADVDRLLDEAREPSHRLRGDYPRIVDLWRDAFGDRFRVFLYDDLVDDAPRFLERVCRFLGAEGPPDDSRVARRSNRDPRRVPMPDALAARLEREYADAIAALYRRVPGVADRWLGRDAAETTAPSSRADLSRNPPIGG